LRKLPAGLGTRKFRSESSESDAWAIIPPPGTAAASKPLVAARNSRRPMAEIFGFLFMRLLGKRNSE